jgi:DNA invertase Pin-like site-specific DNA recombinase
LQGLLAAIRAGQIDIIVVYKVDRLTRSLADFAKLIELFDAHNALFVSPGARLSREPSHESSPLPYRHPRRCYRRPALPV